MVSFDERHKLMQQFEIVLVVGQQHAPAADGVHEMRGILFAIQAGLRWNLYVMSGRKEQADEQGIRRIVIQIEIHSLVGRAPLARGCDSEPSGRTCNQGGSGHWPP